jgi:hypothetical protein
VKKTFKQGNNAPKRMITKDNCEKDRETEERKFSRVKRSRKRNTNVII